MNTYKELSNQFLFHIREANRIAAQMGINKPFSGNRLIESLTSLPLGHQISQDIAGHDAFDERGKGVEYKSIQKGNGKGGSASYNIGFGDSWEEQENELARSTLGHHQHFIARIDYDSYPIVDSIWRVDGVSVFNCLRPKIRRHWEARRSGKREMVLVPKVKDPRSKANLSMKEIMTHGELVHNSEAS